MILAMAQKGHSGKMTDCEELGLAHRTTYGYFLSKGKWNHTAVETVQRRNRFQSILSVAESEIQPVYISIDDTVVAKKKASKHAVRSTEGVGWNYSRLEGKQVFGFQIHAAIVSTSSHALCYSLQRCCPEHGTKVDMTLNVIDPLAETDHSVYVLIDSWYTNVQIWDKYIEKKCHLIGAMKSNRILYPNGMRMSASDYAATLTQDQFHLVTVKGQEYFVHRYEGSLNKLKKAVVLLTYPKGKFWVCNTSRVFLCSDFALTDAEILEHYTHHWKIEVMFKQQKRYLGLKSFMIRTATAMDRFPIILTVAWFFLTCKNGVLLPLYAGIRSYRVGLTIF